MPHLRQYSRAMPLSRRSAFSTLCLVLYVSVIRLQVCCHAFSVETVTFDGRRPIVAPTREHNRGSPRAARSAFASKRQGQWSWVQLKAKDGLQVDGTGRGLVLLAVVMSICIWMFSIPPEFRRAHFCFVEECVQNRSKFTIA